MAVKADVSSWTEVQAMATEVERAFGSIEILVNNAGWVVDRLFVEKPRAEWEKEVQINLWGMINCTRAVLDGMIGRSRGAVVSKAYPLRRVGTPADIAPVVLFLASEAASFVTGQTLSVSGGYSMV